MTHRESNNFLPSICKTKKQQQKHSTEEERGAQMLQIHTSEGALPPHTNDITHLTAAEQLPKQRKLSVSSLCNTQVRYFTVTTQQSLFKVQVAAGKQLFTAELRYDNLTCPRSRVTFTSL